MKIFYAVIIGMLIEPTVFAQVNLNLLQKTWIKTKSERLDGSRIVDHHQIDTDHAIYRYNRDSLMTINPATEVKSKYAIIGNYLVKNTSSRFLIEKLTDEEFIYAEVKEGSREGMEDDEINRYYFAASNPHYYDNLIVNHLVKVDGDTIVSSNMMYPYFNNESMFGYIMKGMGDLKIKGTIAGEFIVSPTNLISNININETTGFNDKIVQQLIDVLKTSTGKWILPKTTKPYFIKTKFKLTIYVFDRNVFTFSGGQFTIEDIVEQKIDLTPKQKRLANEYYNKGLRNAEKGNYNESIDCFTKCIENDSIFLNAYYNRAYAYYTINKLDKACADWRFLSELGQMKAIEYYKTKCKK